MARARNIKPGFFKNEDLAECSPWARLCFIGLWTLADRDGRLEDRPKRIKGELFSFDNVDVGPLLQELERFGFILRYKIDGLHAIQILKFTEHQAPHYSEKKSVIKPHEFRETDDHHETEKPEDSEKGPIIKRGSQPPDSLNPDSLIQETTTPPPPKRPKREKPRLEIPDWLEAEVWALWDGFRVKKSGKGWTAEAQALSLRTLATLRTAGNEPRAVIEQSIERGWTGLFEVKSEDGNGVSSSASQWWRTKEGIEAKGRELGMYGRGTEDHWSFAERIKLRMKDLAHAA